MQSDVIVEMMAENTKHMAHSMYSVQSIWIFRISFILRAKIITFLHKQSRYRNSPFNTKIFRNAVLMVSTLLLRDLLKGFIGLPFGSCCVLCAMAYADWVPYIHFNHKSFYFLSIHLFHWKCFTYFFSNADSLVFCYMSKYDESDRSSSTQC